MDDFEILSCAPEELYGDGGFYDREIGLDRLVDMSKRYAGQITILAEIFPGHQTRHAIPAGSLSPDPDFADAVAQHFHEVQSTFTRLAPALLVRIRNAIIWQNMLFVLLGNRAVPIYEFYRTIDRTEKGRRLLARLAACETRERLDPSVTNALFVGSAGSFNYGHWLVDDFPSLAAGRELRRNGRTMTVLMSKFADDIDRTRVEGTALALGESGDYGVRMLDRNTAYHVRNLHYVTPSSYHPHLKSAHALRFVRETCSQTLFDEPSCAVSDRLFVNRAEGEPRRLVNNDAVVARMTAFGFAEIHLDRLSLREQWATFANARQVVGIMGAAMTSSLLCPAGTAVTHLAPVGWIEPFYWNLAAVSDHRYAALFGPADRSSADIYRKNFSIDIPALNEHLSSL